MKKGFSIIEILIVFFVLLGMAFFLIPITFDDTKQATFVANWNETYKNTYYTFSILKAQNDPTKELLFKDTETKEERSVLFFEYIMPYFRFTKSVEPYLYNLSFLNKKRVKPENEHYFQKLYLTKDNEIIGINWFGGNCQGVELCGKMLFDVNGIFPPNTWGKDVFGINIYKDKIKPMGEEVGFAKSKEDCLNKNLGVYCSYYYIMGGKFD